MYRPKGKIPSTHKAPFRMRIRQDTVNEAPSTSARWAAVPSQPKKGNAKPNKAERKRKPRNNRLPHAQPVSLSWESWPEHSEDPEFKEHFQKTEQCLFPKNPKGQLGFLVHGDFG